MTCTIAPLEAQMTEDTARPAAFKRYLLHQHASVALRVQHVSRMTEHHYQLHAKVDVDGLQGPHRPFTQAFARSLQAAVDDRLRERNHLHDMARWYEVETAIAIVDARSPRDARNVKVLRWYMTPARCREGGQARLAGDLGCAPSRLDDWLTWAITDVWHAGGWSAETWATSPRPVDELSTAT